MFNPVYITREIPGMPGVYQMIPVVGGLTALLDFRCWFGTN
jgi:hypothetical protein